MPVVLFDIGIAFNVASRIWYVTSYSAPSIAAKSA
jgi:hypothetical protein